MVLSVYHVLVGKSSILPRISVNVLRIQDGMDMDVLLLRNVRMAKNGMSLNSCVNAL